MRRVAVFVYVLFAFSCNDVEDVVVPFDDVGGAARIAVHLPMPEGTFLACTQGAGGSFSHRGRSTAHDLDFDTSNTADEEIFAPVSGRARVHTTRPAENFGIHVNIDLGDGTYVVLGHLKRVFVRDGEFVAAGQLLAHEGCTGLCTGDHVHVGRHLGDAGRPAEYGQSIPLWYYVRSLTAGGGLDTVAGDDAACGVGTGATYASALKTALWHPNGTALKTPVKDTVYLVEQGRLRAFADRDAMVSRGYRAEDVVLVSETEPHCYPSGPVLAGVGQPVFGPARLMDGSLVMETGKTDVYVVSDGAALPVWDEDTLRLMGYGARDVYRLPVGGIRARFTRVGECVTDRGCILPSTPVRCGGAFLPPPEPPPPAPGAPPVRILTLRWNAPDKHARSGLVWGTHSPTHIH